MNRIRILIVGCLLLFLVWFFYGLIRAHQEANIYEIEFKGNNPTEYIFPFSIDSVKRVVENIDWLYFKTFVELKEKSAPDRNYYYYRPISAPCGSYVFRYKGANRNNPVRQHYEQMVELFSVSEDSTKILVNNVVQQRIKGVKFWMNLRFNKKFVPKEVPAESTTIEEYEMLRYIGKCLGYIEHMPHVQYPPELSKDDILYAFGGINPFSMKEMFEDETDTTKIGDKYRAFYKN